MAFKRIHCSPENLLIHEGHGHISFDDIREELSSCYENEGWTHHALWDLRDASLENLTTDEVRRLANKAIDCAKKRAGMKNAWVALSPVDFGICRMSQMLTEDTGLDLAVFDDFAMAIKWITD